MTEHIEAFHFGKKEPGLWNTSAEAAVLGAILNDNIFFDRIGGLLKPEHFAYEVHQDIFALISERMQKGKVSDALTVHEVLKIRKGLNPQEAEAQGEYIAQVVDAAAFGPEVKDYAQMIFDYHVKRSLVALAEKAVADTKISEEPSKVLEDLQSGLLDIIPNTGGSGWQTMKSMVEKMAVDYIEGKGSAHLLYGITDLDERLGGLFPGDLLILAGRPSMGKTALVNDIVRRCHAAGHQSETDPETGKPRDPVIGVFDLEMTEAQISQRYISARFLDELDEDLPYSNFRQRKVDFADLGFRRRFLELVDDTPTIYRQVMVMPTFEQIKSQCRILERRAGNLDLIVIDYLQLINIPVPKNSNMVQELTLLTMKLKAMAKEFGATCIVLSQLSRAVDTRDNKRPLMTDLRGSGGIEQDADTIHLLYREEYYLERDGEPEEPNKRDDYQMRLAKAKDKVDVITPKLRMGVAGDDRLTWNPSHGVFFGKGQNSTNQGEMTL